VTCSMVVPIMRSALS